MARKSVGRIRAAAAVGAYIGAPRRADLRRSKIVRTWRPRSATSAILDFSRVLAGPLATMVLGDLGATVIKVERPGGGDDTRAWGPPYDDARRGDLLPVGQPQQATRSRSTCADAGGRARARALAARGRRRRRELPPRRDGPARPRLRRRCAPTNPGLVYCSITGFGAGAGAALPGYDLLVQALGGLMSITGERRRRAAEGRRRAGRRDRRAVRGRRHPRRAAPPRRDRRAASASRSTCCRRCSPALVNQGSAYTGARRRRRSGWATATRASRRTSCSTPPTGELVLAVGNDRQFAALCEVLGAPRARRDERFATNPARVDEPRRAARRAGARASPRRAAADWVAALLGRRRPGRPGQRHRRRLRAGRALGLDPIVELPPLRSDDDAGATSATVATDATGDTASAAAPLTRVPRNPVRMSVSPPRHDSAPPALGELSSAEALRLFGA